MNLRAAAALAHDDRHGAVDELRRQLCTMAIAAGATPNWTTLTVTGPTEMAGVDEAARFEWTASVVVQGVEDAPCPSRPETDTSSPSTVT